MRELAIAPGPKIGAILDVLLAETIEDPLINTREKLLTRARVLLEHNLDELRTLAQETIEEKRNTDDQSIKQQHFVQ